MRLVFAKRAVKDLESIDRRLRDRIRDKLVWFSNQKDPLSFAEPLMGIPGLFRYRIGSYRAIVTAEGAVILVLRVRKRSEAYR